MVLYAFAHRLLLMFGFFVLVITAFTAAKINLLGPAAFGWVEWGLSEIGRLYDPNKNDIDIAAKLIGAFGSFLMAVWTIHRGWQIAERNLPARIAEFNARWKRQVEDARPRTLPMLANHTSIATPYADAHRGWLARHLRWLWDPDRRATARAQEAVEKCKGEFNVLKTSRVRCRAELVSAELELGQCFARLGNGEQALHHFQQAVSVNSSDMDALELSGKQASALGQSSVATDYFARLERAAAKSGNTLRRARAMRFQSEILKSEGEPQRVEAKNLLEGALGLLNDAAELEDVAKSEELSLAYGQLCEVQTLRGRLFSARTAFNRANAHMLRVERLDRAVGQRLAPRLEELLRRLEEAEKDRDSRDAPSQSPHQDGGTASAECSGGSDQRNQGAAGK